MRCVALPDGCWIAAQGLFARNCAGSFPSLPLFFTPGISGDRNPQTGPMETTAGTLFGWGQSASSIHSVNQLKLVRSR